MDLRDKQLFLARLENNLEVDIAYKAVLEHQKKHGKSKASEFESAPSTISVDDGLSLYKNGKSPYFWCRVKLPKKAAGDIRLSTKKKTITEASMAAIQIRAETLAKFEAGTLNPTVKNSWYKVCWEVIHELKSQVASAKKKGEKRPSAGDYIPHIELYILPFPGWKNKDIKEIEYPELCEMARHETFIDLKKTTATKRKTALSMIFQYALERRYISQDKKPDLPKFEWVQGEEGKPFDIDDREIIISNFLNFYESTGPNKITKHNRKLLPLYYNFLCETGMRTGEEVIRIKWNSIKQGKFEKGGKTLIAYKINVTTGKMAKRVKKGEKITRKSRDFTINSRAAKALEQVYYVNFGIKKSLSEIVEESKDAIIFAGYQGREPLFADAFKQYMSYLKKHLKDTYTLYSCRHEYINRALEDGINKDDVASLCGTSVATINTYYDKFRAMKRAARILSDEDIAAFNPDPEDIQID